jgi:hypothetical protein
MCNKLRLGLFAVVVGVAVGCGSSGEKPPATISGVVRYGGQPLKGGEIFFHAEGKAPYHAFLNPDGTYEISWIEPGPRTVTVDTEFFNLNAQKKAPDYSVTKRGASTGAKIAAAQPKGAPGGAGPKGAMMDQAAGMKAPSAEEKGQRYVKIPAKYRDPKTSGLSTTIQPGKQTKDFDLTD